MDAEFHGPAHALAMTSSRGGYRAFACSATAVTTECLLGQVRLLEQKAYEAEVALEEQHEAAQALLEGSSDDQEAPGASGNMIEGLKAQVSPSTQVLKRMQKVPSRLAQAWWPPALQHGIFFPAQT